MLHTWSPKVGPAPAQHCCSGCTWQNGYLGKRCVPAHKHQRYATYSDISLHCHRTRCSCQHGTHTAAVRSHIYTKTLDLPEDCSHLDQLEVVAALLIESTANLLQLSLAGVSHMIVSQAEPGLGAAWHTAVDVRWEGSLHEDIICYIETTAPPPTTSLPQLNWMHPGWSVLLNLTTTLF